MRPAEFAHKLSNGLTLTMALGLATVAVLGPHHGAARVHAGNSPVAPEQQAEELRIARQAPKKASRTRTGSRDPTRQAESPPAATAPPTPAPPAGQPTASTDAPPKGTAGQSAPASAPAASRPEGTVPAEAAEPAAPAPPPPWTAEEVAAARTDCDTILAGAAIEWVPADPMRQGACGTPAPITLRSIGATRIAVSPPALTNCRTAAALAKWAADHVQPAALDHLGSPVTRIFLGTSYQCRNRYGQRDAPLSEHALANALDITGFKLADGRSIQVREGWGPTQRDLAVAAAKNAPKSEPEKNSARTESGKEVSGPEAAGSKAKEEQPKAATRKEAAKARSSNKSANATPKEAASAQPLKSSEAVAKRASETTGADTKTTPTQAPIAEPRHALGAPRPEPPATTPTPVEPAPLGPVVLFWRGLHRGACSVFGTVLGPEANEAHRDHFHLDMKERRRAAYCQ